MPIRSTSRKWSEAAGRRSLVRRLPALLLSGLLIAAPFTGVALAQSAFAARPQRAHPIADYIAEAAWRFGVPIAWIRAVMDAESAGDARAVSRKGAMGLMQIMPDTWSELRARYGLGRDPFDPRDNILAGAAYLREMHDRYGSPGFLAAYNAGPQRYDEYLAGVRALPAETRAYVAMLAPLIGGRPLDDAAPLRPIRWRGRARPCSSCARATVRMQDHRKTSACAVTTRRRHERVTPERSHRAPPAFSSRRRVRTRSNDAVAAQSRCSEPRRTRACGEAGGRNHNRTMAG